jgi:predicted restriction endonuclease
LIEILRNNRSIDTPDGPVEISHQHTPEVTEREALQLARIGQGRFRAGCNQIWDWRCALTGVALQEVLRASHIKAWSKSTNAERLDPYNGLLLAAHVDALFDRHLISFRDDGQLMTSVRVGPDDLRKLGIDPDKAQLSNLHERHKSYLAQHRKLLQRDSS